MWVSLSDPNLRGPIEFEYLGTPKDLEEDMLFWIGRWSDLPGTDGRVLLSEPSAWVYYDRPDADDPDPYPDFLIDEDGVRVA